jgi:trehalose-6-phosphate synthase
MLRPDDLVWVHDYHLIPMAENLRRAGDPQRIGFFLHTPFPSFGVLAVLLTTRACWSGCAPMISSDFSRLRT